MAPFPFSIGPANDLGRSDGREAVHQCDADLDFGRLAVSAVWRSGSLAAMRSPKALRHLIFASIRLRTWYTVHRFQNARPYCRVARRVSFLAIAAGLCSFHGHPFLRIGAHAVACRSMMEVWQRRDPRSRSRPCTASWARLSLTGTVVPYGHGCHGLLRRGKACIQRHQDLLNVRRGQHQRW